MAAREMGRVDLGDALALTLLMAEADTRRFEHAAVRWAMRFAERAGRMTLTDLEALVAALRGLVGEETSRRRSAALVGQLASEYAVPNVGAVVSRWLDR